MPLILAVASGFAGLGYQIVWTQQCALWLGHETAAVLAVVSAFFGGLAIGARILGSRIESSARPARWYAGCELVIASWGVVLIWTMAPVTAALLQFIGAQPGPLWQWVVAFCGSFLLLLPATAAMGATLPALERAALPPTPSRRSIAPLYACNTLGAVVGVLATAYWVVPHWGLARTAALCVGLNVACAAISLLAFARYAEPAVVVADTARQEPALLARLLFTGLLGIGYEVLVVRVLSQVAEDTVYTFAMLLTIYLIGTALGAAAYERRFARSADMGWLGDRLLAVLAMACLLGAATLWGAEQIKTVSLARLGSGMSAAIAAETLLAVAAFGFPTLVMGALFSHLSNSAQAAGGGFGRALAANMAGGAIAPLVFGVAAFALLGPKFTLLLIGAGYLGLIRWRTWAKSVIWIPAVATVAMAVWMPPLAFIDIPDGGHVVSYEDGAMAAVSVVEDAQGVSRLRINNRQQEGSSSSLRVDARQALLPMLLHSAPRRALFLGLGTGVTASAAAQLPGVQVDAVELLPEVITASAHFRRAVFGEADGSRLHPVAADARRYVKATTHSYDVIVADNFHPARSGSGALYTVEHFAAIRQRLAADGIFCQWLPLHQLDLQTLRSIVQSFTTVFPGGWAMLASNSLETPVLGLVGRLDDKRFDFPALHERIATAQLPPPLRATGIEDEFALLGGFVAGSASLRKFAGDAPPNTDDHPVVTYLAPRITYAPDSEPRDRLMELLTVLSIEPDELVFESPELSYLPRLAAYWKARDQFIRSGRDVRPNADVRAMLAQVQEPLLSALRLSPDFRPAYDPLLLMAGVLAQSDAVAAANLLQQLIDLQPARREAAELLRDLHP